MLTATDITIYFSAEKKNGLIFLCIGLIAIMLGLIFFFIYKKSYYKGLSVPLILIGLIQLFAGATIYNRSDRDALRNIQALTTNPSELREKELPRMVKVNRNFEVLKWVEIALVTTGLVMVLMPRKKKQLDFWRGLGLGIAAQAVLMLFADLLAEQRAHIYTTKLISFINERSTAHLSTTRLLVLNDFYYL